MDFQRVMDQLLSYHVLLCTNTKWDGLSETLHKILIDLFKLKLRGPKSMKRTAAQLAGRTLKWCGMTEDSILDRCKLEVTLLSENDEEPPHDPIQLEQIPSKLEAVERLGELMQVILDVLELMHCIGSGLISLEDVEFWAKETQKYVEKEEQGENHAGNETDNSGQPPPPSMEYSLYVATPAATQWGSTRVDRIQPPPSWTPPPKNTFDFLKHEEAHEVIYSQLRALNNYPHQHNWVPYASSCYGSYNSFAFVLERQRPPQLVYQQPKRNLTGALIKLESNRKTLGRQAIKLWPEETA